MANVKRFGYWTTGIIFGLAAAGLAYHFLGVVGVAVSNADNIRDLHVAWFPLRAIAAISAARFTTGRMICLREK